MGTLGNPGNCLHCSSEDERLKGFVLLADGAVCRQCWSAFGMDSISDVIEYSSKGRSYQDVLAESERRRAREQTEASMPTPQPVQQAEMEPS